MNASRKLFAALTIALGTVAFTPASALAIPGPAGIVLSPVSQANAIRSAQSYLEYSGFSRIGLIRQLVFEEYSQDDAIYAVDHITVDWNYQATRVAKSYLEYSAFSRDGLINQLEFDGFTPAQAAYGAASTGL